MPEPSQLTGWSLWTGAETPPVADSATGGPLDLDTAYARYAADARDRNPLAQPMSETDFDRYSLGSGWLTGARTIARRVVQTCRLMIGIHDYEYYIEHMRSHHPQATPLSREAFYRYCLEARFPGAGSGISRCPC